MGYENLEKIKSKIFKPCANICITHITQLATKDKNDNFKYCHNEFTYKSTKYKNKNLLMNINLDFDSYLLIEDISRDWTDDRSVRVGYMQLPILIRHLKKVLKWFEDEKYDTLYFIENGELHINAEFKCREVIQLGFNKGLIISPTIINDEALQYEGVEIIINNKKCIGKVTIDNFIAMYELLKSINLYQAGLTALAYIGRPTFDIYSNYVEHDNYQNKTTSHINKEEVKKDISTYFKY